MFSTTMTGAFSAIAAIEKRRGMLKTGVYSVMLESLTEIHKRATRNVPAKTKLLRGNIRIAIMADWMGKRVVVSNTLIARGKSQRKAKSRIKRKVSIHNLQRWMNDVSVPSSVHGSVYAPAPYAKVIDRKGGISKPSGFLSYSGRIQKIIFKRKLFLMTRSVARR